MNAIYSPTEQVSNVFDAELDDKEYADYVKSRGDSVIHAIVPDVEVMNLDSVKESAKNLDCGSPTTNIKRIPLPFVPPPWKEQAKLSSEFFVALESWEGVVEAIGADGIAARLVPDTAGEDELQVVIKLDEIDDEDRLLAVPGAIFYWRIGYFQGPSGRRRTSIIRFRRLPRWTKSDKDFAEKEARRLHELFGS